MKFIANIFQKIFMQVWVLALSTLLFVFAVFMLTDLRNYKYVITEGLGEESVEGVDGNGVSSVIVSINSKAEIVYTGNLYIVGGLRKEYSVTNRSGYKVISGDIYLDVYQTKDGERVFVETIDSNEYKKIFYDLEYGRSIEIVPRIENIKLKYPDWRIYVPVLIFIFTVPLMVLSVFLTVIKIIEKVKIAKKS